MKLSSILALAVCCAAGSLAAAPLSLLGTVSSAPPTVEYNSGLGSLHYTMNVGFSTFTTAGAGDATLAVTFAAPTGQSLTVSPVDDNTFFKLDATWDGRQNPI